METAVLKCEGVEKGMSYDFFSFTAGRLRPPIEEPSQVDLILYFDEDDCSSGALIGHDDRLGYLFPIGMAPWSELAGQNPPISLRGSVEVIKPIRQEMTGLVFWLGTPKGDFYLVKIKSIQPATFEQLASGGRAAVELEWVKR